MADLKNYAQGLFSAIFGTKSKQMEQDTTTGGKAPQNSSNELNPVTVKVIQILEGGYFHPDMMKDGRMKPNALYSTSGETMFGIDRKAGGAINDTPAGRKFWGLIDGAGWAKNAKWNYKGGALAGELATLAAEIIRPEVEKNFKRYLTPEARAIVNSSPRLLFHFIYGTWNGAGWFKHFASVINGAVKAGETNPANLFDLAIKSRTEIFPKWAGERGRKLIASGGKKILEAANNNLI